MAKRKSAAAEAVQPIPADMAAPTAPETAAPPAEQPNPEQPTRQYRANPFRLKTINLSDGYKIELQESRPDRQSARDKKNWEMQIKFGDGSLKDKPSDTVIDAITSHKITVETKSGPKEVNQFHWNNDDRAWGMEIAFDKPRESRQKAERVFADVVDLVARERGASRGR
jgi:hypothetical protein